MKVGRPTVAIAVLLAGALFLFAVTSLASRSSSQPPSSAAARRGTAARFTYLAEQHSNRCDLDWRAIGSMPSTGRLQGSCCQAMDAVHYHHQVAALQQYRSMPLIPRDPYDISVALAQRLLTLRSTIQLGPAERGTYRAALAMSPEHGPCCCHCWRWQAFGGLGKYLVHERDWPAPRLASLIGDLDGCGGTA